METEFHRDPAEPTSLGSPHFDDETTLLSARPVVRLTEIESKTHLTRHIPLLATAVLSGTLVGVIMLQLGRPRADANADTRNSGNKTVPETSSASSETKDSSIAGENETKPTVAIVRAPVTNQPQKTTQSKNKPAVADSADSKRIEDERQGDLIDQPTRSQLLRQARRLERRAEREAERNSPGADWFKIRDSCE